MTVLKDLLSNLKACGIQLRLDGDRLRFKAPEGAMTPDLRTSLKQYKTELVTFLQECDLDNELEEALVPVPRGDVVPVSFAQYRLWFLNRLSVGVEAYNVPHALLARGKLSITVLERAVNEIIRRHESLRTRFVPQDGRPFQVIDPHLEIKVRRMFLEDREKLGALAVEEARRPFNLEMGPLLRIIAVALPEGGHLLMFTFHHMVSDGWAMGLFFDELSRLYAAFLHNAASPLAPLTIQCADFAHWQRRHLGGRRLERLLDWWRERLHGKIEFLQLPLDQARPAVQQFRGAKRRFTVEPALYRRLLAMSNGGEYTLFMILLAVYATVLARYTGQNNIVIGTSVANRTLPETERLIAFFINTLVLPIDLSGTPSFSQLLARVRDLCLGAYQHQEMPFEKLVEALKPDRALDHTSLFQTMFVLQNAPNKPVSLEGVTLETFELEETTAKFDLTLFFMEWDGGLEGILEYNTDLFEGPTIDRMVGHLLTLADALVTHPHRRLSRLDFLTPLENQRLTRDWADGTRISPSKGCPLRALSEVAARDPDRPALVHGDRVESYAGTETFTNTLARRLCGLGVGPGTAVAVVLPHSPELVAALFAVGMAGGAFVPLEPEHKRMATILADVDVLISGSGFEEHGVTFNGAHVILEIGGWDHIEPAPPPESGVGPDDLAYVLYTSGSTGGPKGVEVTHAALTNYLHWCREVYFGQSCRGHMPLFSSIGFDFTLTSLFCPILMGAAVYIFDREREVDDVLATCFAPDSSVDAIKLTPSHIGLLTSLPAGSTGIGVAILGGESLDSKQIRVLQRLNPAMRIFNEYGPTEATVGCVVAEMEDSDAKVTIGRPIYNSSALVLDRNGLPCPVGVRGELFLAGACMARGYRRGPKLTAAAFLPHPFELGRRVYRSGDLCRRRVNGELEYLGRIGSAIKIRGYRIEPGEIVLALGSHPRVSTCHVTTAPAQAGGGRLVAYVVVTPGTEINHDDLREHLQSRLPAYMIPAVFIELPRLPLTVNAKVDEKALPCPGVTPKREFVSPRNEVEARLVRIWQDVLNQERVGIHDNFFELGGDSILMMRIVSRAAEAGLNLSSRLIYEQQTPAELASRTIPVTAFIPARQGPVPLTPIQRWFFDDEPSDPHHFNQSILLDVPADCNPEDLRNRLACIVARHDAFHLRFSRGPDGWQQYLGPRQPLDFQLQDPSESSAMPDERLQGSLNLEKGPLFRARFFPASGGAAGRLLLLAHHLVVDAVSWSVIIGELARNTTNDPEMNAPSFVHWARGQAGSAPKYDRAFWETFPTGAQASLSPDFPAAPDLIGDAAEWVMEPGAETSAFLAHSAPAYRIQAEELLLAALTIALNTRTGGSRFLVEVESHGRHAPHTDMEAAGAVGWFTAIYPLALEAVDGDALATLRAVKQAKRSVPDHGLGYGIFRYAGGDDPLQQRLRSLPKAEILFNYLGRVMDPKAGSWRTASEQPGYQRSPRQSRAYPLEINALFTGDQLKVHLIYGSDVFLRETVSAFSDSFSQALTTLECELANHPGPLLVPADFPACPMSSRQLASVLETLPRPPEDLFPLTPLQQGMLFHGMMDPGSLAYFERVDLTIAYMDVPAFKQAWLEAVNMHDVLRTVFLYKNIREPIQAVLAAGEVPFQELDWGPLGEDERERRIASFLENDHQRGFDFNGTPLSRFALLRAGSSVTFIWSFHHALLDGWSTLRLLQDVLARYRGGKTLKRPTASFRDFATWVLNRNQDEARAFWEKTLEAVRAPTRMFEDADQDPGGGEEPGTAQLELCGGTVETLRNLAREHHFTLNVVVQAAWSCLLGFYCGESRVLFGAVCVIRPPSLPGSEEIVGLCINTVPVLVQLRQEPSWLSLTQSLLAAQFERQPHEAASLADIRNCTDIPGKGPLFDTLLVFQNYPMKSFGDRGDGSPIQPRVFEKTHYPLTIIAIPGEGLTLQALYNPRVVTPARAQTILEHLGAALEHLAAHPSASPFECPFLTKDEERLLRNWNETAVSRSPFCLHDEFSRHAQGFAGRSAVCHRGKTLTYRELDQLSDALARRLQALGAGPDVAAGLCVTRSLFSAIGVLAILKSGAVITPLDPSWPAERLVLIGRSAGLELLLTEPTLTAKLPDLHLPTLYLEDADLRPLDMQPATACLLDSNHGAYIVFTSGSTGTPKGVFMSHGALSNLFAWQICRPGFQPGRCVLQFAPLGFDVAFQEMFTTWYSGGILVYPDEEDRGDPIRLFDLLCSERIERLFLPFVALQQLAEVSRSREEMPPLMEVITAGEQLVAGKAIVDLFRNLAGCRLYNQYGPAEAHVVTEYLMPDDPASWSLHPPIGTPIDNIQIHVLDGHGRRTPPGVAGEIHIGGLGLARGYLDRPEVSAQRFVPSPFGAGGERLYRTGDLVRRNAEGRLIFLGRIDHQVKIRGYRVEPDEVAVALRDFPRVTDAAVVAVGDNSSERGLTAYLVLEPEAAADPAGWRAFLSKKLPDYMVPTAYQVLDEMPLTLSGKLDRLALPARIRGRDLSGACYTAPTSELEAILAAAWAEVLQIEEVGVNDDFFSLGGHSLHLIRLTQKISSLLGREVSMRTVYQRPSPAALAAFLDEKPPADVEPAKPPHRVENRSPLAPYQGDGFSLDPRPALTLFATGRLQGVDAAALLTAPESLLATTGSARERKMQYAFLGLPAWFETIHTAMGDIALIMMPIASELIFNDTAALLDTVMDGLALAGSIGARHVSLTGLIPSATRADRLLQDRIKVGGKALPRITTGHPTTVAAVVRNTANLLAVCGRDLGKEHLAILGMGSIGRGTLHLLLRVLPHPRAVTLCDVFGNRTMLERERRLLRDEFAYAGPIGLVLNEGDRCAGDLYQASLIVGATSLPGILEVDKLQPGTLLVDDSHPHCLAPEAAIERLESRGDLLFTEGGTLRMATPTRHALYWPDNLEHLISRETLAATLSYDLHEVMGCAFSALLTTREAGIEPVMGPFEVNDSQLHYRRLEQLGVGPGLPRYDDYLISPEQIRRFCRVTGEMRG